MSCLQAKIWRINALQANIFPVCKSNLTDTKYLRVSPTTTQWITPYEVITYNVESNTSWRVE